jgi:hypothetical protein
MNWMHEVRCAEPFKVVASARHLNASLTYSAKLNSSVIPSARHLLPFSVQVCPKDFCLTLSKQISCHHVVHHFST